MANMGLNRRTFLQKAGLGLAMLGVSETVLSLLGDCSLAVPVWDRYFQVLAQPGGRKLALLVGINQYPRISALAGCVTDVELQRELLIHRFGFKASDILTLTDSEASREGIETAFVEHLTEQAKAGDVVVFHFSGYGSRVKMSEESQLDQPVRLQNTLVPVDGILPSKGAPVANDLLEDTLVLLLRSLATDRVTTVLDTSYTDAGVVLKGNLRVRSSPNPPAQLPSPGELAFQEQLRLRTTSLKSLAKVENRLPGIVLTAAGPSQAATEAQWHGFSAGLFTYALTQHLWQATPATTIQISLSRAAGAVNQLVGKEQQPRLVDRKSLQQPLLAYYLPSDPSIGADGVVTSVEDSGRTAYLWLAGIPAVVLEYYSNNSLFSLSPAKTIQDELKVEGEAANPVANAEARLRSPLVSPTGSMSEASRLADASTQTNLPPATPDTAKLQLRSKEGLIARARLVDASGVDSYSLQVGQLVREAVRVLPRTLSLTVALDTGLERIERVDATSAFATVPFVSSVVVAGEQPADYLFGKATLPQVNFSTSSNAIANSATPRTDGVETPIRLGGYGLFYLGHEPIGNTTGEAGEAVKSAINRLTPKLATLLAAKLLRLTANEGSSRLGVRASLELVDAQPTIVMQRETLRASAQPQVAIDNKIVRNPIAQAGEDLVPSLPVGSRIRYRLENYSDRPIYFMLLGFDPTSSAIALYGSPSLRTSQESDNKPPLHYGAIAPGETLTLPQSSAASDWVVQGPAGIAEIQLICSREPFTKASIAMEASQRPKGDGERIGDLYNPLDVAQAVLQDLHQASASASDVSTTVSDTYALDVNAWATLSFVYQVV
ncbi:MAG TPA: caspase family protein [Allocoleopsis sp.]